MTATASPAVNPSLNGLLPLQDYRPLPGTFDEMMAPDGSVRPHWEKLVAALQQVGPTEMKARGDSVQRLLGDHGVTYNIYNDGAATHRPWALDLVPFVVSAQEMQTVSEGLKQRSLLLHLIMTDLYGPQRLVKEGWIPPALLHANPGFLRVVHGITPPGGRFVSTMGTDLVRGADGAWRVLIDRTQAPSGKGYTLENRILLSTVFPQEFKTCSVQRLAAFYDRERESLRSMAPAGQRQPTIVLLTPGPLNETYFEHAFKARYLGFPLVEGNDLTVRGQHLHLKTLEGLRRVDVVVRRVDDLFCDPLELRSDTFLGVPGLMEAWRAGNVSIVNGLGAGLVETPALHPFLPGLCKHLLQQQLKLPCLPTWWCGQPQQLKMLAADPSRWVVKQAFAYGQRTPIFLDQLTAAAQRQVLLQIEREPHAWVAQERLQLSTAPTWVEGKLVPRSLVWRAFTLADESGCTVMPGGLTRVAPSQEGWSVTMQSGGISKDTWVITDGPVDSFSLLNEQVTVIRPARPPSGVPSRVADHLFWLGRYAERLEQTVRVLRTILLRMTGEGSQQQTSELQACTQLLQGIKLIKPSATLATELPALLTDPKREGSLPELLGRLRFNASSARDRLSDDTWRLFNRLAADLTRPQTSLAVSKSLELLDTLILDLAAFSGMMLENMTRGHGWRFLEIGRRLERSLTLLSLLKSSIGISAHNDAILTPLLEICDSSMTYRRLHFARPTLVPTVDLLLLNPINPRSVVWQLHALARQANELPVDQRSALAGSEKAMTDRLLSELASLNLNSASEPWAQHALPDWCQQRLDDVEELSGGLTEHYFSHAKRLEH